MENGGKCMKLVKKKGLRSLLIKPSLTLMVRIREGAKKEKGAGRWYIKTDNPDVLNILRSSTWMKAPGRSAI